MGHDYSAGYFREMDRNQWSIEVAAGVEDTLLGIFGARNVPDDLQVVY
jgi:hypothetical protein